MFFAVCDFVAVRAALCAARVAVSAAVSSSGGCIWGVSDPHFAAPFFAPRLLRRGSLTPQMLVIVVRQNRAVSATSPSAPPLSPAGPTSFPSSVKTPDRFRPEAAFI
jgi:hypothetical protein